MHSIEVIGTGYVGLPAAIMLARAGHKVLGVDVNKATVDAINAGKLRIKERALGDLLADPTVRQNLRASQQPAPADVFLIAVPTPVDPRRKVSDLSYVRDAVASICPHLRKGNLVIVESTIPPLTCREVVKPLIEEQTGLRVPDEVMLAHCPERVLPGKIVQEIVHNDRIIGGMDERSAATARAVYESFVQGKLLLTDDITAELCKLMENTYRDVNIALANEMCEVARGLGVDWRTAFALANRHPRVTYLNPGIGVGGHCIPIDPWFIAEVDPAHATLIQTARRVNDNRPAQIATQLRRAVADVVNPLIVAIGATYKPDTEDMRESPAVEVVQLLQADGYQIRHYDPMVPGLQYESLRDAVAGSDLFVILVNHTAVREELREHHEEILSAMRRPMLVEF